MSGKNVESYTKLKRCRLGGSDHLISVLNLGSQTLTGVFPKSPDEQVTSGPLELVWCPDSGLLQLNHSFSAEEMYGENYGYRSGLNQSMVDHLSAKVNFLEKLAKPIDGDVVLDIGSNDCTTLKAYEQQGLKRVGIDPTGDKFKEYYPDDVTLLADFFSSKAFFQVSPKRAKIVSSIAMFYDLEDPVWFAKEVEKVLADDGIWHFEQSYLPSMLRMNSYDTICHEHLEYYSLSVVEKILSKASLKIVDVGMNNINGGSFAVTAAKAANKSIISNKMLIDWMLEQEKAMGLGSPRPYREFEERVFRHRDDLRRLIYGLVEDGKKIYGYGASTKGNVILQFCGFTSDEITAIAEINEDKFGRVTPGSNIPIISEKEAHENKPDYFLVLPWHFKDGILRREKQFLASGGKFIFPFPEIEIV